MRSLWKTRLLVCTIGVTLLCTNGILAADKSEEEAIAAVTAQFYAALNATFKGQMGPMDEVWSHADDVTYMGPTGTMQVGWKKVRANWKMQAELHFAGEVKPEKLQVHAGSEIAVTCGFEVGENTVEGEVQKVSIRATNIYRKENGQWKMIGHHTDLLPFLEK